MNIPFKQTPNFSTSPVKKIGYVFHGTLGTYESAKDWLSKTSAERTALARKKDPNAAIVPASSCHYIIGRNPGEVTQIGLIQDVTWHAGNISNPAPRFAAVMPKKLDGTYDNPNKYFIGIEFVWGYDIDGDKKITAFDKTLTEWQYECVCQIIEANHEVIPFDPAKTFSHHEIASYKSDNMSFAVDKVSKILGNVEEMVEIKVPKSKVEKVLLYIKNIV
jgi:N-acetyl-anhydromuramyl-L-alanine amidase AmpD